MQLFSLKTYEHIIANGSICLYIGPNVSLPAIRYIRKALYRKVTFGLRLNLSVSMAQ